MLLFGGSRTRNSSVNFTWNNDSFKDYQKDNTNQHLCDWDFPKVEIRVNEDQALFGFFSFSYYC